MNKQRVRVATAAVVTFALIGAACGSDDDSSSEPSDTSASTEAPSDSTASTEAPSDSTGGTEPAGDCETPEEISLQLQWFTQAQFAGYYAAQDQGFYEDMCLDVTIVEGGVEIVPQTQLANGDVDFALAWVPKALASREAGADITNIAQIYQRSGTLQVSFADAGITTPEDFAGKNIGNWGFGNEYEVFAAIGEAGLDPATDVTLVGQQFDMVALLDGSIDAAEAMTYNEYAQVLETVNPDTGELYTPEDFNVISYEEIGVGMLQDAIWADAGRLADDAEYSDQATRFVAASIQGWVYCRDNPEACRDIVVAAGSTLGASHQLWQTNEVNKLIWPSPDGIGYIDANAWDRTVEISQNTPNLDGATVLTAPPTDGAYTNEIVEAAWAMLTNQGLDLFGDGFEPIEVTLNEGGE
ncbi:MAG TPA: ABC transporter substrate-binding protein [Ilumatobacteraceae bacterium]|nr:ABC transporter substrate-binding protein [Ilumatobacteraceae bacterium]